MAAAREGRQNTAQMFAAANVEAAVATPRHRADRVAQENLEVGKTPESAFFEYLDRQEARQVEEMDLKKQLVGSLLNFLNK